MYPSLRLTLWGLATVALCSLLGDVAPVAADTSTFTRSDITGNDIDCGQGSGRCRVCGDINAIDSSCRANPACNAYTFDNSCGFLKSAGEPRTYREGYSSFILSNKSPTGGSGGSSQATPAPAGSPATSSPVQAAAAPAPQQQQQPQQQQSSNQGSSQQNYNSPAPAAPPPDQQQQQQQYQQQQQNNGGTMQVSNGGSGGRAPWPLGGFFQLPGRKLRMMMLSMMTLTDEINLNSH